MAETRIRWPKGYANTFFAKVRKHRDKVLQGRMLCIDPATGATSNPGWALYEAGAFVAGGDIQGLRGETPERLTQLFWHLTRDPRFECLDILVIEQLRGSMVAAQLHWSVGVCLAALPAEVVCEIPIPAWKAVARADPHYVKGDAADARAFGATVLLVAAGLDPADCGAPPPGRQRRKRGSAKRSRGVRNTARGHKPRRRGGSRKCRASVQ